MFLIYHARGTLSSQLRRAAIALRRHGTRAGADESGSGLRVFGGPPQRLSGFPNEEKTQIEGADSICVVPKPVRRSLLDRTLAIQGVPLDRVIRR